MLSDSPAQCSCTERISLGCSLSYLCHFYYVATPKVKDRGGYGDYETNTVTDYGGSEYDYTYAYDDIERENLGNPNACTVLVFRHNFSLKDAMSFTPLLRLKRSCMHAANVIPLGWPLLLPVDMFNSVQTLKVLGRCQAQTSI